MKRKHRLRLHKVPRNQTPKPLTKEQRDIAEIVLTNLNGYILAQATRAARGYPTVNRRDVAQELRTRILRNIKRLFERNPKLDANEIGRIINANMDNTSIETMRATGHYRRRGRERFPRQLVHEKRLPDQQRDGMTEKQSLRRALVEHIRRITPKTRDQDIVTQYIYGKKIKEIATSHGLTRAAIESVIQETTKRLRKDPEFIRKMRE